MSIDQSKIFNFGKLYTVVFDEQIPRKFKDDDYLTSGYFINISKNVSTFTATFRKLPMEMLDPCIFRAADDIFKSKRILNTDQNSMVTIQWNQFLVSFVRTYKKFRCIHVSIEYGYKCHEYIPMFYHAYKSNSINSRSIQQYTKWINELKLMYGINVPTFRFKCTYYDLTYD